MARSRSFFVRVWTSVGPEGPQWAGSVERVQLEGEHRQFTDPEAMLAYLRERLLEGWAERENSRSGQSNTSL